MHPFSYLSHIFLVVPFTPFSHLCLRKCQIHFKVGSTYLHFFWSVLYFSLLCQSLSSISRDAANIKNLIHELPADDNDIAKLSLFLKLHRDFVGIKILESIDIIKSLVIEVFGRMLIYGLIFATFNIMKHLDIWLVFDNDDCRK